MYFHILYLAVLSDKILLALIGALGYSHREVFIAARSLCIPEFYTELLGLLSMICIGSIG